MSVKQACELLSELIELCDNFCETFEPIDDLTCDVYKRLIDYVRQFALDSISIDTYGHFGNTTKEILDNFDKLMQKSIDSGIKFKYNTVVTHGKRMQKNPRYYVNGKLVEKYCGKCTYFISVIDDTTKCASCKSKSKKIQKDIEKTKKLNELINDPVYTEIVVVNDVQTRKCIECERYIDLLHYNLVRATCNDCMIVLEYTKPNPKNGSLRIEHRIIDNIVHKYCGGCFSWKLLNSFRYDIITWDGIMSTCIDCRSDSSKKHNSSNRRRITKNAYNNNKRQTDVLYRLTCILRGRLCDAVKGYIKSDHSIVLTGCTWIQLKTHIENQFTEGMSWELRGKIHIDHIIPCSLYNLADPEEQRCCFNYRNLQPLWAKDNMSKGNRISKELYLKHRHRLCKQIVTRLDESFDIDDSDIDQLQVDIKDTNYCQEDFIIEINSDKQIDNKSSTEKYELFVDNPLINHKIAAIQNYISQFNTHRRKKFISKFIDEQIRSYINDHINSRKNQNEHYKRVCTIKQRMSQVLGASSSDEKFNELLGYDVDKLVEKLGYDKRSQIEYIIPREMFDLKKDEEIKICLNHTNLKLGPVVEQTDIVTLYWERFNNYKHILPDKTRDRINTMIQTAPNSILKLKKQFKEDKFDDLYPMNELLLECDEDFDIQIAIYNVNEKLEEILAK